jgi:hypothetical protein
MDVYNTNGTLTINGDTTWSTITSSSSAYYSSSNAIYTIATTPTYISWDCGYLAKSKETRSLLVKSLQEIYGPEATLADILASDEVLDTFGV